MRTNGNYFVRLCIGYVNQNFINVLTKNNIANTKKNIYLINFKILFIKKKKIIFITRYLYFFLILEYSLLDCF